MHMILKSALKMAQTSTNCIPHLVLEDDCAHNHASYNCNFSDVLSHSNGVRRWDRPIAGKMSARTSLSYIFLQILHDNAVKMEEFTSKIRLQYTL